ncbi:MAG: hypothetical protein ABIF11_03645 [Nitrospirota bacterium]
MKKFIVYIVVGICVLSNKVSAEELSWGTHTVYAPMPVLFIHGINANMLTWEESIPKLTEYFGYRTMRMEDRKPINPKNKEGERFGITYFKDGDYESPAKLYLEAFDYGGQNTMGSFYSINSNYGSLTIKMNEILQSYYGDNWKNDPNAEVNIIAHSQGGLVARDYIQKKVEKGEDPKVKRLITIGTPHRGSGLATVGKIASAPHAVYFIAGGIIGLGVRSVLGIFPQVGYVNLGAVDDMRPKSPFLKQLNANVEKEKDVEYVAIAGLWGFNRGDLVVSKKSQLGEGVLEPLLIGTLTVKAVHFLDEGNQWQAFLQAVDGIPDKGTRTHDTPKIDLVSPSETEIVPFLKEMFEVKGYVRDYLPGSSTVTIELKNNKYGTVALDWDGKYIYEREITPVNMVGTETDFKVESRDGEWEKEYGLSRTYYAKFRFKIATGTLDFGTNAVRVTVKNPAGLIGTSTVIGTPTTNFGKDWIPFIITKLENPYVVVRVIGSSSLMEGGGTFTLPAGLAAKPSRYWVNPQTQQQYEEFIGTTTYKVNGNSYLVYKDPYAKVTPYYRNRTIVESEIFDFDNLVTVPKIQVLFGTKTPFSLYRLASNAFTLIATTTTEGATIYLPETTNVPDGIPDEVNLFDRKIIHPILPAPYNGIVNRTAPLRILESVVKGYDYVLKLSDKLGVKSKELGVRSISLGTVSVFYIEETNLTPQESKGATCYTPIDEIHSGILVNAKVKDEYNQDKLLQAYGNLLVKKYTKNTAYCLSPAFEETTNPQQAFLNGYSYWFSCSCRKRSTLEVGSQNTMYDLDLVNGTGTSRESAVAGALWELEKQTSPEILWQAIYNPLLPPPQDSYDILDLLDELTARGIDVSYVMNKYFGGNMRIHLISPIVEQLGLATDLTGAYVYQNPTDGTELIFAELTQNVRIRVFTVVGEEVFNIEVPSPNTPTPGKYRWNCNGSNGQKLASGIYIYLLTNAQGQKKTGKLGIIR